MASNTLVLDFGPRGGRPYTVTGDDATRTFTLTLGTPFTDAIYGFESPQTGIVCPAGLADPKQMLDKSFGSGAFVIDSFTHGDSLVLRGRPDCQDWRAVQRQLLEKHHLLPLSAPEAYAFSRGIDFQQAGGLGFIEPASLKRRAP